MAIEVEARFRVTDPEAIARLASMTRLGAAELGTATRAQELDEYLDTAGGALAAAGWACRLRQRGGVAIASLKGPPDAGTGGWLHRRPEVEGPAIADAPPEVWPPSDARRLLDRLRGGQPLVVRLTLRQQRTEREVTADSQRLGVLSVDDVTVVEQGHTVGGFGIVELELAVDGVPASVALSELAAALAAVEGLVAEPRSKLERAIELVGPS
jgi:inorganic triphosphatase YgiF